MLVRVKVIPNAKEDDIVEKEDGRLEVKVKAKPVLGKANANVVRMLSYYYEIPEKRIRLVKGFKNSSKIFQISD